MHMPIALTRRFVKLGVGLAAIAAMTLPAVALSAPAGAVSSYPENICPVVGQDSDGCGIVITINAGGSATQMSYQGPYDYSDDVLVTS